MLRRLYDWTIKLSGNKNAHWALAAVSFAESSFFPVPPDVMLVPMTVARPEKAWFYAGVCTIASVLGALVGYAIGALLYDTLGHWLISLYGYEHGVEEFRALYAEWGAWIILIKGLTPIPFKIVTIASGFAGYNLFWFVLLSLITRGARFFIVAGILNRYGEPLKAIIEDNLGLVAGAFVALIVAGFVVAKYVV
ncbi:MAG: YqaA family protein [Parvibaculum sp.]|uniref:YqaA family protein n=1 Tax=Parvibaculum sp. TaxID=2024848 RepID=UPI003C749096